MILQRKKEPHFCDSLEARTGFEPVIRVLQTHALPLGYRAMVTPTRFELVLPPWKGDVLTAWPWGLILLYAFYFVITRKTPRVGLEPTTARLTAACSTDWAIEEYLKALSYTLKTTYWNFIRFCFLEFLPSVSYPFNLTFWLSPRPISNSQLHALLHFHLCPIYLVVFKGSYSCDGISHLEGGFTLRCLQRLSRPDLATLP